LYKNKKNPLQRGYYYSLKERHEINLLSHHNYLKNSFKNNQLEITKETKGRRPNVKWFRSRLIKDLIKSEQNSPLDPHRSRNNKYLRQLKDIALFEKELGDIISKKFINYSSEYLYGRDINSAAYHQYLFGMPESAINKQIVADPYIEFIKSRYNWSQIESENTSALELKEFLKSKPANFYTAIIPEPDQSLYSLLPVDNLDLLLLNILKTTKNIDEVLTEAKSAFDPMELKEFGAEFELLIIGRIKMALKKRIIKAMMV
jgi:hypothetical protein